MQVLNTDVDSYFNIVIEAVGLHTGNMIGFILTQMG